MVAALQFWASVAPRLLAREAVWGNRTEIDGADALNLHDEFPLREYSGKVLKCLAFIDVSVYRIRVLFIWQTCCYHEIQNAEQGGVQLRQGPKRT